MRRRIRVAGWTLVWSGIFLLGFAFYQLYVTDLINSRAQEEARDDLVVAIESRRRALADPVEVQPDTSVTAPTTVGPVETLVHRPEQPGQVGEPLAELRIPTIGVDEVVFEGVDPPTLKLGPGHMPWTPVPGQPGNAVISGHRTTYGRPFFDLDLLAPGDVIEVETAIGTHIFTVAEAVIVTPTDVWVTEERPGAWLTLTTCNPRYSARERLVVFAELTAGPNLDYARHLAREAGQAS